MSTIQEKHKPPLLPQTQSHSSIPESKKRTRTRTRKSQSPFHGVRKRKWGRYVSEIRLPGQKTRIWLGSFDSPEKAARAYDSAALFVKGNLACLNFPDSAGLLPRPKSGSRKDIQSAAAKAATELESPKGGDSWWGELETLPFEEVKDCPLLSPQELELVGAEYSWSFMEDDELMLSGSCFEL